MTMKVEKAKYKMTEDDYMHWLYIEKDGSKEIVARGTKEYLDKIAAAVNRDAEVEKVVNPGNSESYCSSNRHKKDIGHKVLRLYKPKPRVVGDLKPGDRFKRFGVESVSEKVIYLVPRLPAYQAEQIQFKEPNKILVLNEFLNALVVIDKDTPCEPVEEK